MSVRLCLDRYPERDRVGGVRGAGEVGSERRRSERKAVSSGLKIVSAVVPMIIVSSNAYIKILNLSVSSLVNVAPG